MFGFVSTFNWQHYRFSLFILLVIFIFQLISFIKTRRKINLFGKVFPNGIDKCFGVSVVSENESQIRERKAGVVKKNSILSTILDAINSYLEHNKSNVSDYHLIKDIVDRNCDAAEEEIRSQQSTPIFYGLMGTMIGILVGVGMLYFSDDGLVALFNVDLESGKTGVGGVQDLLGGVALAMSTSIFGIIFSVSNSRRFKNAKAVEEAGKHEFLSWIQAELLPELATDSAAVMNRLSANLNQFNERFQESSAKLSEILEKVVDSYKWQTKLMDTIKGMDVEGLASANIRVYQELKNCSDEIGLFSMYMHNVNDYIDKLNKLNDKLDDSDRRTKMIEDMGNFFMRERANIERMDGVINRVVNDIHETLKESVINLKESSQKQIDGLIETANQQCEQYKRITNDSQKVLEDSSHQIIDLTKTTLEKKSNELSDLTNELKQMTAVKDSMEKQCASLEAVKSSIKGQSDAIVKLSSEIKKLAEKEVGIQQNDSFELPGWVKPTAFVVGGVVVAWCLFNVAMKVLPMFGISF